MSEDKIPNVEEIKERLKIEEEDLADEPQKTERVEVVDITGELQNLGKQVAETLKSAWQSEERQKVENQVKEGVQSFANEIDKAMNEFREGQVGQKFKSEVSEVKSKVETSEVGGKTTAGIAQGLRWLSVELAKLADQFTSTEKDPNTETGTEE